MWLVAGHTDMRKGFDGLAALVQTALTENPFKRHVFAFRGRRVTDASPVVDAAGGHRLADAGQNAAPGAGCIAA